MRHRAIVLKATQADVLPSLALRKALTDAFFEYAAPYFPIVDAEDLSNETSSILLQQAVCLVGSLMRHDPSSMSLGYSLYEKIQTLLHVEFEQDNMALLKTLCLMSCWAPASPYSVTLHGPWHWTGIAVRLAIQMGIHTQSNWAENDNAGCSRRIFWHLNSETLMVACWGRPRSLKLDDCDVQPLSASDFTTQGLSVLISLHFTGLMNSVSMVSELNTKKGMPSDFEVESVITSLCTWQGGLPDELRLYDANGTRKDFHRYTSELHIHYLTSVIVIQMPSKDRHSPWRTSSASILAATRIAELYEEIHCREESVHLLSINGFMALVAAIVLIFHRPHSSKKEEERMNGIESICSVLRVMSTKYGGARSVLQRIQGLQSNHEKRKLSVNSLQNSSASSCAPWVAKTVNARVHELFPFSLSLDENVDFLDEAGARTDQMPGNELGAQSPIPLEHAPDTMFSLMDILEMDFDPFDNTNSFV
ncbi:hypothetical protein BDP55DRAFT_546095 [Colletotrichum godetiae]|uniref:Xylanolytic transcriptional activator regulatory domain-containing protein n=1 Tax=Colletotrichum godetiae TaxID=1209918 RepID=A0AAJ0AUQ0_9PEZI|nr:uncharacterized protein BDP55DRAFT_546095 [Colletotrichum godetiae]KAK1689326.1 hypothetical protein BDP55DRAFT_546095 [Colletotrichum godetiae]